MLLLAIEPGSPSQVVGYFQNNLSILLSSIDRDHWKTAIWFLYTVCDGNNMFGTGNVCVYWINTDVEKLARIGVKYDTCDQIWPNDAALNQQLIDHTNTFNGKKEDMASQLYIRRV